MAKRILLIVPLLFIAMFGLRFWLQHVRLQEQQDLLQALQKATQRANDRIAQETPKKLNDDNVAELAETQAKLAEIQRHLADAATPTLLPEPQTAGARHAGWQRPPHSLVVAAADIAWKSLDVAHAQSFVDRGKRRELTSRLHHVHLQLQKALGGHEHFPSLVPIHQWLLEVEGVLFDLEIAMKPGDERDFAQRHVGDLRDTLSDLLGP